MEEYIKNSIMYRLEDFEELNLRPRIELSVKKQNIQLKLNFLTSQIKILKI